MNGGKAKFVTAREKRMRAQAKRNREHEQAALTAAQQQQSLHLGMGTARVGSGEGIIANPSSSFQALLASRQMLLQHRQIEEMRLTERLLASELAARKQREEVEMCLLQQSGSFNSNVLPGLSQLNCDANSNYSSFGDTSLGNIGSVEQLLTHHRLGMSNDNGLAMPGNMIDRYLLQYANMNRYSATDMYAVQEARNQALRQDLSSNNVRQRETDGNGKQESATKKAVISQIDEELVKMYLMEQQRQRDRTF